MNEPIKRAPRATTADLHTLARQGVERALAARRGPTELTPAQAQAVSGAGLGVPVITTQPTLKFDRVLINGRWSPEELFNVGALQQQFGR